MKRSETTQRYLFLLFRCIAVYFKHRYLFVVSIYSLLVLTGALQCFLSSATSCHIVSICFPLH